ncbi:TonB-dependent receptor plug domain-containing protein, partial [Tsuneonella rigui]|uniref:TonB-dependent receptor plug domain-containing protein n=1 Tax=Tsuneonella rigui TaxID=1708790 RepID=UPI000F7E777F
MRSLYPVSLLAVALAGPTLAQDAAPVAQETAQEDTPVAADDQAATGGEIVVTATRLRGQVDTDSPPVLELEEADIAAYGSGSIADLVAQLAPQTGSGRGRGGRPLILVNGQRISNFREIGRFPPEAIRKVEVLPEEVALKFGYPPDARVINFILKDSFSSRTVELATRMPFRGDTAVSEAEGSLLTIAGPRRVNVGIDYTRTTPLTEAERGVIQAPSTDPTVAGDADPAAFRTLVARDEKIEGDVTFTTGVGGEASGKSLTLNGQVSRDVRTSLSGLDTVLLTSPTGAQALRTIDADPITRRTATDSYSLGAGFNAALGDWQLSSTLDANRTDTDSRVDRRRDTSALIAAAAAGTLDITGALPTVAGAGTDRALSRVWSASQKNTLSGTPVALPGGEVNVTFDAGYDWTRIESQDTRTTGATQLTRGDLNAGVNVSVPIASRREGFLDAIGDLSVNFGGGIDHLSDFGTLTDWNVGANWKPVEKLSLQGSYTVRKVAPGLSQLGGPTIVDVNVPVYDFATGQTVLANVTTGGNPNLLEETQRDIKLSASYDLDWFDRANVRVEYFRNRSENTTESFPLLTPAVEAAFPGRVTRDAGGNLISIDRRPVTFAERSSSRIRYGINLFGKVGKPSPQSEGQGGGRGGFGALMAAAQPAPAAPAATTEAPAGRGQFDPTRFAEMRAKFCAAPAGQVPDLSGLPERMTERLKGPDGQIDPAKIAEARTRMCNADGTPRTDGGGMGGGQRTFDPARFAALRTALSCGVEGKDVDIASLPPEIADRLKGPDGTIDPARLAEFRTRMCALPADGSGGFGGRRR